MAKRIDEESIVQSEKCCWLCANENYNVLERHEAFFGTGLRQLSIEDKLTVLLCATDCHRLGENAVHNNYSNDLRLKVEAQQAAMDYYGWTVEEFAARYGKNYLDVEW